MYLDSAYIAKFYVNEPDAVAVRALIRSAAQLHSSSWALLEVSSVFRRHVRQGDLTPEQGHELMDVFGRHVLGRYWNLIPMTDALLRKTAILMRGLPPSLPLRAGDAIHLVTAIEVGEAEIWTNDRHLLAAAGHFGIAGRCV